ncbi:TerD family protein [Bacillus sp. JJ1764]|uniref:TerD family protein n=1 Tax=Bacillus sp. JJ1764 TaxID=3122964 RepID=UPI002FFF8798
MAINLQRSQRVNLTQRNPGLSEIIVSLGWNPVLNNGGLFGALFGIGDLPNIDCDASVIMLGKNDRLLQNKDVIYFGNLSSHDGSVQHSGDSLTGSEEGEDECIKIDLNKVPSTIQKLVFVVTIYEPIKRQQHFGMIKNAFIKIVNATNQQELLHFNITEDFAEKTSLLVGELYRDETSWKFSAIGEGIRAANLSEVVRIYG